MIKRRINISKIKSAIFIIFIFFGCGFTESLTAAPIAGNIKLDHFGYRTTDQKTAYFTANPGASVEVHDAGTNALVYTTSSITSKGADTSSPLITGDTLWWVDFSAFTTAGHYYLLSTSLNEQSYNFQISDCIYQAPMTATLKALYYQRCGVAKPATYAGANWADAAPCHPGDAACAPAPGCTFPTAYGTLNLSGGWHDAGDYNKYLGTTPAGACNSWGGDGGSTINYLLTAYEFNPALFPDSQTNIPESGNGISDLLDECKWELDWYLKMQMTDKHILSVVHQTVYTTGSPPSTDPTVRYYYPPNPTGEAAFVAVLSKSARVMNGVPALAAYAATLKAAAEATWNAYETTWAASDQKFWAAAEIFRMEKALGGSAVIISAAQAIVDGYKTWNGLWLNENQELLNWGMLAYVQATGATAAVVANIKTDWGNLMNDIFTQNNIYNSGMHSYDYFWGANEIKMDYALELIWGALLGATGTHTAAQCLQHAEDYLHYMHGSNPVNMVFMTNAAALGASHGVWRIYHSWFGNYNVAFSFNNFMGKPASVVDPLYPYYAGTDNYGISDSGPSTYGPPPGIVPDGPSNDYYADGGKAIPPLLTGGGQPPYEKDYRDWNYSDPTGTGTVPWIINETGIYYISSYMIVASSFISACGTPTFTPTYTPVLTPTFTPTRTATCTSTRTATPTFTWTVSPTFTGTRTNTPANTSTSTPANTATFTSTQTRTATGTYTRTATPTFTFTLSPTFTGTRTNTPVSSATNTPVNTSTFTRTASPSFTATATPSFTSTRTNTPSFTSTNTPTFTASASPSYTRTVTPTFTISGTPTLGPSPSFTQTRTATPSFTVTATGTNTQTFTFTRTNTASYTSTVVITPTYTATFTRSATASVSQTNTFTRTPTATASSTPSPTGTNTATSTFTVSPSATQTATPTYTATGTFTRTFTGTATLTRTATFTRTATLTATDSPVYSPTETVTGTPPTETITPTGTGTDTEVPTDTDSPTDTNTPTSTFTPTDTDTASPTATYSRTASMSSTPTPVNTFTNTPVNTATRTATLTFTRTSTPVVTPTNTPQGTLTNTPVFTASNTAVNTATRTATSTRTFTAVSTSTNTPLNTPTRTMTVSSSPTLTITITFNPVSTATVTPEGEIKIDDVVVYPCPVQHPSDPINLLVQFTGRPAKVTLRIYTTGFRCVREETWDSGLTYPSCALSVAAYKIAGLSNGTYYYVLQAEDGNQKKSNRKIQLFLVLR